MVLAFGGASALAAFDVAPLVGNGGQLMLAGVSEGVVSQMERTGLLKLIGRENVFPEQPQWGAAANQALEAAEAWLETLDQPKGTA